MGESTKAVCALFLIVALSVGALAWFADRPDAMTWSFRIGGPLIALFALGIILKLQFRTDAAHDYLRKFAGTYFNRDGFCFAFSANAADGIAYLNIYFGNQYDQPSVGRVALRPAQNFFHGRANFDLITCEIQCPPAAFGVAQIAVAVPQKFQGKSQSFEVGASVAYPNGKGRRVRFHDGVFLRMNSNFGNAFGTAFTLAGAAAGAIVLSKPATVTIPLPVNVSETLPGEAAQEITTLWQLGDPPLEKLT